MKNGIIFSTVTDLFDKNGQEFFFQDFNSIQVETKDMCDSNDVLCSVWRQLNEEVSFDKTRCRWFYTPRRVIRNANTYILFGKINCVIGEVMLACSLIDKYRISQIAFFIEDDTKRTDENNSIIESIIKRGIARKAEKYVFSCECEIHGRTHEKECLNIGDYSGKSFSISNRQDKSILNFAITAHDEYSARNFIISKIVKICDIMSVETNTIVDYNSINVEKKAVKIMPVDMEYSDEEFIDFIPLNQEMQLLLQRESIDLIDNLITDRCSEMQLSIINSASVFREGLELEYRLKGSAIVSTDMQTLCVYEKNRSSRVSTLSLAVSLYMSALENLTVINNEPTSCESCGQLKYGITSRVGDIISKYFGEEMSRFVKKIYSKRSKYLHTSHAFMSNPDFVILPLLSSETETRCVETGFSSIQLDGQTHVFFANNVREWISYIIRKELIFSISEIKK